MTDTVDSPPAELLEIWRRLNEERRESLLRVARALDDAVQEQGEQLIYQDGGGWGVG